MLVSVTLAYAMFASVILAYAMFILFPSLFITGWSSLLIMIALQLNRRPASASFPVVLQIVQQCCFDSIVSAFCYLFHRVTLLLAFSLSSLLSFNPSAFCPCFSNIVIPSGDRCLNVRARVPSICLLTLQLFLLPITSICLSRLLPPCPLRPLFCVAPLQSSTLLGCRFSCFPALHLAYPVDIV